MAFSLIGILALLVSVLSIQKGTLVDAAKAEVVHQCPYNVWCALVYGYKPDDKTPEDQRPLVNWQSQAKGSVIVDLFNTHAVDTGVAIMCTREPKAQKPLVTQLEYAWRPDLKQTFFDISNVEGQPFVQEGFRLEVTDPVKPLLSTCSGAYCKPGDAACEGIYLKSDDDFEGMRTCSEQVDLRLTLCSG